MRIVKPPRKIENYHIECRDCHAVIGCAHNELRKSTDQRDGITLYVMICPVHGCAKETWIHEDVLPKHLVGAEVADA